MTLTLALAPPLSRYASPEGKLPALDDALANEVSENNGLTWESLDALLRERVERESAIQDSKQAFRAAEDAMLAQLPTVELLNLNPSPHPNPSPDPNPNPNPTPNQVPGPRASSSGARMARAPTATRPPRRC